MANKNLKTIEKCMLKGFLRKNGFELWRLTTNAISVSTGKEHTFFFEFYLVNPCVSPDECVLGFKTRFLKTPEDLQYALAGTESAKNASTEDFVVPSFFMVRAGSLSNNGKFFNNFYPYNSLEINRNDFLICAGKHSDKECILSSNFSLGNISVELRELNEKPEYFCNSGSIIWNLQFDDTNIFRKGFSNHNVSWDVPCCKINVDGKIVYDGEEFIVIKDKSYGFLDRYLGKDFASPYFHLHSSNFTSEITGKVLDNSFLAVQGEFDENLNIVLSVENFDIEFNPLQKKSYSITFDCIEMPEDDDGTKLHWTISAQNKKFVVDIDFICRAEEMFLRNLESPLGSRKVLKVLSGIGRGELKIYKRKRKTLELIEDVKVSTCVCEYGNIEYPEM